MRLVVYGDFNCPFSRLASARIDVLLDHGLVDAEWRAVEHAPGLTVPSEPVTGELAVALEREVAQVRGLLSPGEAVAIRTPPVHPNTAAAVRAYAAAEPGTAHELRRRLFALLWEEGRDIGDPSELGLPAATAIEEALARVARWRAEWQRLASPVIPALVVDDGPAVHGLDALDRLGALLPRSA